jgi:hypothetical protein
MNQFAVMQQQMFDQFQQSLMTVVQMFTKLHKDQIELIRREMDRVQALTRELHGLQSELAKRGATGESPAAERGSARSAPQQTATRPRASRPASKPGIADGSGKADLGQAANGDQTHRRAPRPVGAAPTSDADVHGWLCRRIEAIQQERQSRFQKILSFVLGKGT